MITADSEKMDVRIITQAEVPELLPMNECIGVMESALRALGLGQAVLPLRPVMWTPDKKGALAMMPAYLADRAVIGLKAITYFAGNRETAFDTHQGTVQLFDTENGRLLAVIDATSITEIRTAAVSAVATRLLARPDARNLAILGSGTQARSHLAAMLQVRQLERVRVWSRTAENVQRFAAGESARHGIHVEVADSAEEAARGANLICTTTSAVQPVLQGAWVAPGAHINAVGSSVSFTRELDTQAVAQSRLFVDRKESAINEAGDFIIPRDEGAIHEGHILAELGDVLLGRHPGRESDEEITLFKSLGLAIEDLAAAHHIYLNATSRDQGFNIELGGMRHA